MQRNRAAAEVGRELRVQRALQARRELRARFPHCPGRAPARAAAVDRPYAPSPPSSRSYARAASARRSAATAAWSSSPAGKTTAINMLCTLARPTGGTTLVAGHDIVTERDEARRHIGLVFQDPTLDGYLTAKQNLELYGV